MAQNKMYGFHLPCLKHDCKKIALILCVCSKGLSSLLVPHGNSVIVARSEIYPRWTHTAILTWQGFTTSQPNLNQKKNVWAQLKWQFQIVQLRKSYWPIPMECIEK
uniref:Uncharacterized protein n=1 Tax=Pyxicephalus adspersus TaxID=30357 RepID=A0AAV3B534_PYXAD|nr:TPA: hypothetical protein GDO54_001058 [Pyxicephalus adspersus]